MEHARKIVYYQVSLRFDAFRDGRLRITGVRRHLAGHENPAVDFGGMRERGDRLRRCVDHVEQNAHCRDFDGGKMPRGMRT
jgi:hypothetical protein